MSTVEGKKQEKRRALLSRGGPYYEIKEDFSSALDC